mmetsp:Transcript_42968/g.110981  ORF Transcript_42968/g.110981 Transcript_42968/m.110981 type:complete len:313 (-) Transcript_42968:489-1427(-)|eukprot:CAMPEP_0113880842 /NCGR_PEP_ID=MMETSP0780_2-20120614/8023_1 /TAXON_ID=652834 /ORGANISM="Palpitomonas bilix" /LENGTH=312 /DNA_ID=CAMNT_0000867589 /DNA_START=458 /DNA_END=1396 /DNA_ORIENTATION=- /assembly_acc=CAM_ASM_000599
MSERRRFFNNKGAQRLARGPDGTRGFGAGRGRRVDMVIDSVPKSPPRQNTASNPACSPNRPRDFEVGLEERYDAETGETIVYQPKSPSPTFLQDSFPQPTSFPSSMALPRTEHQDVHNENSNQHHNEAATRHLKDLLKISTSNLGAAAATQSVTGPPPGIKAIWSESGASEVRSATIPANHMHPAMQSEAQEYQVRSEGFSRQVLPFSPPFAGTLDSVNSMPQNMYPPGFPYAPGPQYPMSQQYPHPQFSPDVAPGMYGGYPTPQPMPTTMQAPPPGYLYGESQRMQANNMMPQQQWAREMATVGPSNSGMY